MAPTSDKAGYVLTVKKQCIAARRWGRWCYREKRHGPDASGLRPAAFVHQPRDGMPLHAGHRRHIFCDLTFLHEKWVNEIIHRHARFL